jgi:hypothetical protein
MQNSLLMFTTMATLTVIPYTLKPPNSSVRKLPAKPWWINSSKVSVKTLLRPGSIVGNDRYQEKPARDGKATAQGIQDLGANLERVQGTCLDLSYLL